MPLGHLGVNVSNIARAKEYYDGLMPIIGYEPFFATATEFSYQPIGAKPGTRIFFYLALEPSEYSRHRPGLQHLAFMVRSRAAVGHAHQWAKDQSSEILHEPKEFPEYHEGYYATFWTDPEGFMIEVVCHRDDGED